MLTVTPASPRWFDEAVARAATEFPDRRPCALDYEAFPKQREFHASSAKYRLFGGAAGPGKSKAL